MHFVTFYNVGALVGFQRFSHFNGNSCVYSVLRNSLAHCTESGLALPFPLAVSRCEQGSTLVHFCS